MLTGAEDFLIIGIGAAVGFIGALRLSQNSAARRVREIRAATDLQIVRRLAEQAAMPWHSGALIFLILWSAFSVAASLAVLLAWQAFSALT